MIWDGSRGYGSSGDRDKLKENDMNKGMEQRVTDLENIVSKLSEYDEYVNLNTVVLPNTDEGDEFVRKELVSAYVACEGRDAPMLEYVIRMFSNPDQWKQFWEENDLDHTYVIGERI